MSKKIIALVVGVILILGGGVVAYTLVSDSSDSEERRASTKTNEGKPAFNAKSTSGLAFVATMVTKTGSDTFNATIKYDGKGNANYKSSVDGKDISMYLTKDGTISCQGDTCFKLPQSSEAKSVNSDIYEYSQSDIDKFRSTADYKGEASCPAGTCQVWEVEDSDTSYTTQVYLDGEGRPSKLTSKGPQGNTEVTYEYRAVNVNVPTDIKEIPSSN